MASQLLISTGDALSASLRRATGMSNHVELRRALRLVERLTFLIEPLRAYADIEELNGRLETLRATLQSLDDTTVIARAIVRGGRRGRC